MQDCSYHPGEYALLAEWCARFAEEKCVTILVGTGDYVGKWNSERQWNEFRSFLDIMSAKIPGLYIAGNHDYRLRTEDLSAFLNHVYGNNDCSGEEYYEKGRGCYLVVEAGGLNWLIIGMSYSCGAPEREWINSVLEKYPDTPAILLFHDYLKSSGKLTAPGEWIYEEVIMTHQNVRLVLCGHNHGVSVRTDWPEGPDGRFVQSVMYNVQERPSRRGSVQLLRINVSDQTVHLLCQSPLKTNIKPLTENFRLDLRGFSAE
ncbi:MAG: metallophosphoesterase [Clostridiales bacterium]|nr:metallophosphoesterase [Clostridiales bacterium]